MTGHYDEIGSARGLVDASGTVTDTYDMDTFGAPRGSTGSTPNPYRYGAAWGYITDPSGFLQLGARYYWPEVGRFVQQDPERVGINWYVYVGNDPVVETDPTGYGVIGLLRCAWCTSKILQARHHCNQQHSEACEAREDDERMGDVLRRRAQCIEQHTRPGYIAWCATLCAGTAASNPLPSPTPRQSCN